MSAYDHAHRATQAYEAAYGRVLLAREGWADAGCPLVHLYPNGTGVHPLLKVLQTCEQDRRRDSRGDNQAFVASARRALR